MQEGSIDPVKGHNLKIIPTLFTYIPVYQPTEITRKIQNQIFLFQAFGEFLMVYGSTCYKEAFGFDFQFMVAFMMGIIMCNHPSNSNLNPMVTLSFCLRNTKRYQTQLMWIYFKAQFTGAFIGIILTYMLNDVYRFPLIPQENTMQIYFQIMLSQCMGVFILCLFVLQIVGPNTTFTTNRTSKYVYIGLIIYLGRRYALTSYTALNAWITLSRAIIGVWKDDWVGLKFFPLWAIGDVIGCVLASFFYNVILEPSVVHSRVKKMILRQREQQQKQLQMRNLQMKENRISEMIFEPEEEDESEVVGHTVLPVLEPEPLNKHFG